MRKRNQIVAMLLASVLVAGTLTGCQSGGDASRVSRETTENATGDNEEASGQEEETQAADNDLSATLKQKYADSESSKYDYKDPIYNVARDYAFVIEGVGTRYQEDMDSSYYDDINVYIDSNFINPIMPDMEYDPEAETLTIMPTEDSPALDFTSYGDTAETEGVRDWGNAPKYWLVQHNDFATGKPLDKPVVTMFTVQNDVAAPTISFDVDEKGYARLSWNPVEGAQSYEIYELDESAEYGISLASPFLIGETTENSFNNFDDAEEEMNSGEGVTTQNNAFYSFGISEEEAGLSTAYCVVAVKDGKRSNVSNLIYAKDVRGRLVQSIAYGYDGEDAEQYECVRETISQLPAFQLVEMADTAIVPLAIDYANATWEENEFGMATGEGNASIVIHAGIEGTNFKINMYATETPADTIDSDLSALAEKQKNTASKSADVKPENDIDYVPSAGEDTETEESAQTEDDADREVAEEPASEATEETDAEADDTQTAEEPAAETEELAEGSAGEVGITATSALSEYIATYLLEHEEAIDLSMFPEAGDSDFLVNALMEAYNQNPLVGSLNRYGFDYETSTLYIEYEYTAEEQQEMQEAVLAEADKVVAEIITDGMSDVEKEFAINNYLCSTAEYDYDALDNAEANDYVKVDHEFAHSFTPYGVLVNKVGVCASYSGAFKILADKADLDCYVVTGYLNGNMPHAWNRVSLDGEWITVDSTNNDNETYANALLNIPDYMSAGLLVEDDTYLMSEELAKMTSSRDASEFYRVENKYYGADELQAELVNRMNQGETFTIRTDYTMTEEEVEEVIQQALNQSGVEQVRAYMFLGVLTIEM